jgi:hypothetical protein
VRWIVVRVGQRNLVRPECPFNLLTIDDLGAGPALRRGQDDHRPAWPGGVAAAARQLLNFENTPGDQIERVGHQRVHHGGVVAFDEERLPATAGEELFQFVAGNAGQDGRIGDLVAVQVQDRQHRAVGDWIEELVGMPGRRQ